MTGKKQSENFIKQLGERYRGKKLSEKHKEKLSLAKR